MLQQILNHLAAHKRHAPGTLSESYTKTGPGRKGKHKKPVVKASVDGPKRARIQQLRNEEANANRYLKRKFGARQVRRFEARYHAQERNHEQNGAGHD